MGSFPPYGIALPTLLQIDHPRGLALDYAKSELSIDRTTVCRVAAILGCS